MTFVEKEGKKNTYSCRNYCITYSSGAESLEAGKCKIMLLFKKDGWFI